MNLVVGDAGKSTTMAVVACAAGFLAEGLATEAFTPATSEGYMCIYIDKTICTEMQWQLLT